MRKRTLAVAAWAFIGVGLASQTRAELRADGKVPLVFHIEASDAAAMPRRPAVTVRTVNAADRAVVACGVLVLRRDARARWQPQQRYVVRPRFPLSPGRSAVVALPVDSLPPDVQLRPTFMLFADGSWAGDAREARAERDALHDEYVAARAVGEALAALPPHLARPALVRLAAQLSHGLARAATATGRVPYEQALRTLATALDERPTARPSYAEAVATMRRAVDRVLARHRHLGLVTRHLVRE